VPKRIFLIFLIFRNNLNEFGDFYHAIIIITNVLGYCKVAKHGRLRVRSHVSCSITIISWRFASSNIFRFMGEVGEKLNSAHWI